MLTDDDYCPGPSEWESDEQDKFKGIAKAIMDSVNKAYGKPNAAYINRFDRYQEHLDEQRRLLSILPPLMPDNPHGLTPNADE